MVFLLDHTACGAFGTSMVRLTVCITLHLNSLVPHSFPGLRLVKIQLGCSYPLTIVTKAAEKGHKLCLLIIFRTRFRHEPLTTLRKHRFFEVEHEYNDDNC